MLLNINVAPQMDWCESGRALNMFIYLLSPRVHLMGLLPTSKVGLISEERWTDCSLEGVELA